MERDIMARFVGIMVVVDDGDGTRRVMGSSDVDAVDVERVCGGWDGIFVLPKVVTEVYARCSSWQIITMPAGWAWSEAARRVSSAAALLEDGNRRPENDENHG